MRIRIGNRRRGAAIVEFAFVAPVLFVLAAGGFETAVQLDRYLSIRQLTRSAGNLYHRGVDPTNENSRALLLDSSPTLDLSANGDTVLYLTKLEQTAGGMVITERFTFGKSSLGSSTVGTASPQPDGTVSPPVTATPPNGASVSVGATLSIAEVVHRPTDTILGFFDKNGLKSRVVF